MEAGSFKGDFKEAAAKLREKLGDDDLGSLYDTPIVMTAATGARAPRSPRKRAGTMAGPLVLEMIRGSGSATAPDEPACTENRAEKNESSRLR